MTVYDIERYEQDSPGNITDDEDGDDEKQDDGVGPLLDVCLPGLYGGVDSDIEESEEAERNQAQKYQPQVLIYKLTETGSPDNILPGVVLIVPNIVLIQSQLGYTNLASCTVLRIDNLKRRHLSCLYFLSERPRTRRILGR